MLIDEDLSNLCRQPKYWGQRVPTTIEITGVLQLVWEARVRAPSTKSMPMPVIPHVSNFFDNIFQELYQNAFANST